MKKIKLFSFVVLFLFLAINVSNAQEIEDAIEIASIELYDAKVISQEGNKINLSFDLFNGGKIQQGIKYGIQLIDYVDIEESDNSSAVIDIFNQTQEASEMQVILNEKIYEETITIRNNETINKEIEYVAPSYLNGEFEVWIIVKNDNGMLLAMGNLGKIVLEGNNQFIKIIPESCYLIIKGESNEEKYSISQGVDISLDENLQAVCELINNYDKEINFTPYFNTYNRSTFGELIKENESIQNNFIIEANEIKIFTFNIPKIDISQAYDAELTLKEDNNNISNSVVFHYVIQGESATIQNLSLDKDYYLAGDIAEVSVYVTPSADIFYDSRANIESINEFNLKLAIYNSDGNLCTDDNTKYEKSINKQTEELQTFSININKDCYDPKIIAIAENSSGDILAQKEYQILTESVKEELIEEQSNKYIKYIAGLVLFIFLFVIFFLIRKKGKSANLSIFIFLFFICTGLVFNFFICEEANAGTFVVPGISTSNPYAYEWELNSCPSWSLSSPGYSGSCYLDRKWPLGPWNILCAGIQNLINQGTRLQCVNKTLYVSPGYPFAYATDAIYAVSLNKSAYSPGETIIITAKANASWCTNNYWNAYLVVNNNGNWTKIIEQSMTPVIYSTKYITAPTTHGTHTLTFYGSAFKGHDSTGSISSYTMQYTVTSPVPINNPPIASSLLATEGDCCSNASYYFSWIYSDPDDNNQSRFRFHIDNNSNFSSPTVNRDITSLSNPSPTTNNQTVLISTSPDTPSSDQLAYNTTYYWRVMVYDNQAASSNWVNGSFFTTPKNKYPTVDFNWAPNQPSENEDVQFTDQSVVYGGASKSSWSWIFQDGNPLSSKMQNPLIKFLLQGTKAIILQVTDSSGYSCSKTKNIDVNIKLPGWKEVLPF
ncbi:PKD domain-containing protein [Patescibacteria group bacterium]|nr:PKD domain-containing protein [Patescibacteria group bacterium]